MTLGYTSTSYSMYYNIGLLIVLTTTSPSCSVGRFLWVLFTFGGQKNSKMWKNQNSNISSTWKTGHFLLTKGFILNQCVIVEKHRLGEWYQPFYKIQCKATWGGYKSERCSRETRTSTESLGRRAVYWISKSRK